MGELDISEQQGDAIAAVAAFVHFDYSPQNPVFRLDGYAGTGKTTLAQIVANGVKGRTQFLAFTGKAASVLRSKGCIGAATVHSQIYHPKSASEERMNVLKDELGQLEASKRVKPWTEEQKDRMIWLRDEIAYEGESISRPTFALNRDSDIRQAALIIVDEYPMLDSQVGKDLISFGVPIVAMGDPAQLPPISGESAFMNYPLGALLTEIHRQAEGSEVLQLATRVREGKKLLAGDYGESLVKNAASDKDLMYHDQILVGRNRTRKIMNRRMRELAGRASWLPEPGEKLVCLRNNTDMGLLNGTLWTVVRYAEEWGDQVKLALKNEEGRFIETRAWSAHLKGGEFDMGFRQRKQADEFDYGYALTVHKSQGSQWDSVLLVDESKAFEDDADKWLYTGITRAAKRVTVVRG